MEKWHIIGIFETEEQARKIVPIYFIDEKFEAHFVLEEGKDVLKVNRAYWLSFHETLMESMSQTSQFISKAPKNMFRGENEIQKETNNNRSY